MDNTLNNKISIIVPVYNTAKYLSQCLDSLVNQTYRNIEIICVNDGSTDSSLSILKEYKGKYKNIIVIDQNNQGLSSARNNGVKNSSGDWVMFVDSDDWVDITICEELLNSAIKNEAQCVMCSYTKEYGVKSVVNHIFDGEIIWKEEEVEKNFYRKLFGLVDEETKYPYNIDLIVSPCMQLFSKDVCKDVEFIDTKKIGTEDCLYQMMVYRLCRSFSYIDKPLYHYRKTNEVSLTTKYNQTLYSRWQTMYDMMEQLIVQDNRPSIYKLALNNRIAFGLIGLGLNETKANKSLLEKSNTLRMMISTPRYQIAINSLELNHMSIEWKILFLLIKMNLTIFVTIIFELIEKIKRHKI